jgi:hypothetical protein
MAMGMQSDKNIKDVRKALSKAYNEPNSKDKGNEGKKSKKVKEKGRGKT